MINFIKNKKNLFQKTSLFKAIYKFWNIPKLPLKIQNFLLHPIIRVLRVIGGICVFCMVSKLNIFLPVELKYFIDIIAFFQLIQMSIIVFIKTLYAIYIFIYKPEYFEVRNSPLNQTASLLMRIIHCGYIGTCIVGASTLGVMTGTIGADTLLEDGGRSPIFKPMFKDLMDHIHNKTGLFPPIVTDTEQLNKLKDFVNKLPEEERKAEVFNEAANIYKSLSQTEREKLWKDVWENTKLEKNNSKKI